MPMLQRFSALGGDKLVVEDVFSAYTYTGTGSTLAINNGIDLTKGGLIWSKNRDSGAGSHELRDTTQGLAYYLATDSTAARGGPSTAPTVTSTGYSLPNSVGWNFSNVKAVSWTFRKAPKFFDVVTYTGNSAARTLAHSLGTEPGMIFIKNLTTSGHWFVYHRSLGATQKAHLNLTDAASAAGSTIWNSTAPTASVFSLGGEPQINATGDSYVAYLFAHDASADGLIQCGSFTTDGSGNATVNLGWEPQFLITKGSSGSGFGWQLIDSSRGFPDGANTAWLEANTSSAEVVSNNWFRPTATGFRAVGAWASTTIVYVAIRRGPMRPPTSGTQVYNAIARTGTGAAATVTGVGFPPDLIIPQGRSSATGNMFWDRLRGKGAGLQSSSTASESSAAIDSFNMDGFSTSTNDFGYGNQNGVTFINWMFRRYPGVFDVVCYTGDNATNRQLSHNLKVPAELIIVKSRSTRDWYVKHAGLHGTAANAQGALILNSSNANSTAWRLFGDISSSTTFGVGGSNMDINAGSENYVAYLFATLPGVSKVGLFTGTGLDQVVNCGFSNGARFVLIKGVTDANHWLVFDSVRGIVDASDPYLMLNSTSAEGSSDLVDPHSSGFQLPAASNQNAVGKQFIYLAFA